jgi:cell division septal protein FtsQ
MRLFLQIARVSNFATLFAASLISCCAGYVLHSNLCDVHQVELEMKSADRPFTVEVDTAGTDGLGAAVEAPIAMNLSSQKYLKNLSDQLRGQLAVFAGEKLWKTRVQQLELSIAKLTWIDHAYVQRIFPNRVIVSVWTKTPVLEFVKTNGEVIPIATDASQLPAISANHAPDLPIVRDSHFLSDELLRKMTIELVNAFPENGILSRSNIAEIGIVRGHQLWMSLIDQNFVIRMTPTDAQLKIARVTKVLEYLQNKNISARMIDADFSQKVLVKLRH